MSKLNFWIFLCCLFVSLPESIIAEDVQPSEPSTTEVSKPVENPLKKRLLESLNTYEKIVSQLAQTQQTQREDDYTVNLNALGQQGQNAQLNLSIKVRSDTKNNKFWLQLGGDLGEVIATFGGDKGQVLLPAFSIYSDLDMKQYQNAGVGATSNLLKQKSPEQALLHFFEKARASLVESDLSQYRFGEPIKFAGENCDTIHMQQQKNQAWFYLSKASDLFRGIKFDLKEERLSGSATVEYDDTGRPLFLKGTTEYLGPQEFEGSFQVRTGYAKDIMDRLNMSLNGKSSQGIDLKLQVDMKMNNRKVLKTEDFAVAVDPQAMRQVPIDQLAQSLFLGSMGKLMQFQMVMTPPEPTVIPPGAPPEVGSEF